MNCGLRPRELPLRGMICACGRMIGIALFARCSEMRTPCVRSRYFAFGEIRYVPLRGTRDVRFL